MISLRDDLPLIQLANGQAVAFEREWLIESLNRAARKAGYDQWWLAEHVAESVAHYLRDQREWNVIPVERLGRAVQSAVEVIGYGDVARHSSRAARESGFAHGTGSGSRRLLRTGVFREAGRRIWELVREQRCDFALLDLEASVKWLRGRSRLESLSEIPPLFADATPGGRSSLCTPPFRRPLAVQPDPQSIPTSSDAAFASIPLLFFAHDNFRKNRRQRDSGPNRA